MGDRRGQEEESQEEAKAECGSVAQLGSSLGPESRGWDFT
jgi:hypothetical protein